MSPNINWQAIEAYGSQFKNDRLGLKTTQYIDPLKVYDLLKNQLGKKHYELMRFEHKAWIKWYGPQGGYPSAEQIDALWRPYYRDRSNARNESCSEGIDYLVNQFKSFKGKLQPADPFIEITKGMKSSNSGPLLFTKRNSREAVMHAMRHTYYHHGKMSPSLLMTRFAKQKLRAIHNDDFSNYGYESIFVKPLYDIFANFSATSMLRGRYYFQNHLMLSSNLTPDTIVLEGDAEAMDTTVTLRSIKNTVEPVMFKLFPKKYHRRIREFHEKLFTTTMILPTGKIIEGYEHSLLSGIVPTNIYESILMLCTHYQVFLNTYFLDGTPIMKSLAIYVIGDDILVLINNNKYAPIIRKDPSAKILRYQGKLWSLAELQVEILERVGLEARLDKQRVAVGTAFFCKRYYSPFLTPYKLDNDLDGIHSARSLILTANSINNPEYGNHQGLDELYRICGILDDAYGAPLWQQFVDMLRKPLLQRFSEVLGEHPSQAINRYNKSRTKVWDFTLEELTWIPETSMSFQYLFNGKIIDLPSQFTSSF